jgi:hypothetical protein
MTIDWLSFLVVVVAAIVASCVVVTLFATGIRLLATPPRGAGAGTGAARDEEMDDVAPPTRPRLATTAAVALFSLASLAALYGIYLIVPALHH